MSLLNSLSNGMKILFGVSWFNFVNFYTVIYRIFNLYK